MTVDGHVERVETSAVPVVHLIAARLTALTVETTADGAILLRQAGPGADRDLHRGTPEGVRGRKPHRPEDARRCTPAGPAARVAHRPIPGAKEGHADLDASVAPSNERLTTAREVELPPKDVPILAAALAARADLLVTDDRTSFGHLFGWSLGHLFVHRPTDALSAPLRHAWRRRGRPSDRRPDHCIQDD